MKHFDMNSLTTKFFNLAGVPYDYTKSSRLLKDSGCLSIKRPQTFDAEHRDWLETHFGDDWIYDWDSIYFKYEKDMLAYAMRWS